MLTYLRRGIIELHHIVNEDMVALARLCSRAKQLRQEIVELEEASWKRRQVAAERFWASF